MSHGRSCEGHDLQPGLDAVEEHHGRLAARRQRLGPRPPRRRRSAAARVPESQGPDAVAGAAQLAARASISPSSTAISSGPDSVCTRSAPVRALAGWDLVPVSWLHSTPPATSCVCTPVGSRSSSQLLELGRRAAPWRSRSPATRRSRSSASWSAVASSSTPSATRVMPERVRQLDGRAHDGGGPRVLGHRLHERAVELELVDRQLAQVGQRGVAGAEVVDGDPDAEPRAAR